MAESHHSGLFCNLAVGRADFKAVGAQPIFLCLPALFGAVRGSLAFAGHRHRDSPCPSADADPSPAAGSSLLHPGGNPKPAGRPAGPAEQAGGNFVRPQHGGQPL